MSEPKQKLKEFLDLANHYPSPHNGQPFRLRQLALDKFELFFEKERGLQAAGSISYLFSFVSMGVFIRHMELSSKALGHKCAVRLSLPKESQLKGSGIVKFGEARLAWDKSEPDQDAYRALIFRRTSRKKYFKGPGKSLSDQLIDISQTKKMKLVEMDEHQTKQAIWLNQRAVFDDMFDEPVRQELDKWLRYSKKEKESKRDGLAYDCMELNGLAMKFIVNHPKILRLKGVSWVLKQYYLRTMLDKSKVFYMRAPFNEENVAFEIGLSIMDIWQKVSQEGLYLHPFGTIMSNEQAHEDFMKLAGVADESRLNYLVFIFRCGKSKIPTPSLRKPVEKHLLIGGNNV